MEFRVSSLRLKKRSSAAEDNKTEVSVNHSDILGVLPAEGGKNQRSPTIVQGIMENMKDKLFLGYLTSKTGSHPSNVVELSSPVKMLNVSESTYTY
ncbi:hypothetical protein C5167_000840 [Papaver somniferum]|uniref:Uncharacterized protein n=1 Tax=Papaver somniferum TaxID=3469 RepID=A0A4Y7KTM8_PAPSO|nr:hypothetical protein C5167_000840 [Papaver somniferum]